MWCVNYISVKLFKIHTHARTHAKDLNRHFTKEDVVGGPSVHEKMPDITCQGNANQIQWYTTTQPLEWLNLKGLTMTSGNTNVEQQEPSNKTGGSTN